MVDTFVGILAYIKVALEFSGTAEENAAYVAFLVYKGHL